jgi:hypothetical protein
MHKLVMLSFNNEKMYQWSFKDKLFVSKVPCHTRDFKKRSLLINIRTINITVIQPLFAINKRDITFMQKII